MVTVSMLKIVDETACGEGIHEVSVAIDRPVVTVKDIIVSRVRAEVGAYNVQVSDRFYGSVSRGEFDESANGRGNESRVEVDAEMESHAALAAFQANGYFVFIDAVQAEDLNEEVRVTRETQVRFVKITPLAGG